MSESTKKQRTVRLPNFVEALLPIVVMMALMLYGLNGGYYSDAHMPLVVSIVVACAVGCACGHSFSDMLAGMLDRLNATMEAILILMTVGRILCKWDRPLLTTCNVTVHRIPPLFQVFRMNPFRSLWKKLKKLKITFPMKAVMHILKLK